MAIAGSESEGSITSSNAPRHEQRAKSIFISRRRRYSLMRSAGLAVVRYQTGRSVSEDDDKNARLPSKKPGIFTVGSYNVSYMCGSS